MAAAQTTMKKLATKTRVLQQEAGRYRYSFRTEDDKIILGLVDQQCALNVNLKE
jgi:hypothetical protein